MSTYLNHSLVSEILPPCPKLAHEIIDLADAFDGAHDSIQKLDIRGYPSVEYIVGALKPARERK